MCFQEWVYSWGCVNSLHSWVIRCDVSTLFKPLNSPVIMEGVFHVHDPMLKNMPHDVLQWRIVGGMLSLVTQSQLANCKTIKFISVVPCHTL